jgi:L-alanine-DL-glutamate epimerase-like enolase superfamily enzyme
MNKSTDVRPKDIHIHFLPIEARVPVKFGPETMTQVTCVRVRMEVESRGGLVAEGWGETPLSVQWVWPSPLSYEERHTALKNFVIKLARAWKEFCEFGHPVELGHLFQEKVLPDILKEFNSTRRERGPIPWLAALVCLSPFDLALHDAYGAVQKRPVYETYHEEFMNQDLSHFLVPAEGTSVSFSRRFPAQYMRGNVPMKLVAWHLVAGLDPLSSSELKGNEPNDGYPVLLSDWIRRDGLKCLKIKLRGNDSAWDAERIVKVGHIGIEHGVDWLSADFNCTVDDPDYVNQILDRLLRDYPRIYAMILYVEQPFPYDLERNQIDVHSVSARKPLFMDESAHNWGLVKLGRTLGWTGVALKTCKTQTGALLSLCWAKAHGMPLMVQDLANPMLAQIPHLLLAAHAETIMGVETNSMQFFPEASLLEAAVHPGAYRRRGGAVDLSTINGPGFGYRIDEINRDLPNPVL